MMMSAFFLFDSLNIDTLNLIIRSSYRVFRNESSSSLLDFIYKIATVLIAFFNVSFAIYIYSTKNKKEDSEKEKDRKINWLKTLVLDHNLKYLYEFFDLIVSESSKLAQSSLSEEQKMDIDSNIAVLFRNLRQKFVDALLAVDQTLYNSILNEMDELQGHLSSNIFDENVDFSNKSNFDEVVGNRVIETKTEILRKLFSYRGGD